jgi:hypothetical protein
MDRRNAVSSLDVSINSPNLNDASFKHHLNEDNFDYNRTLDIKATTSFKDNKSSSSKLRNTDRKIETSNTKKAMDIKNIETYEDDDDDIDYDDADEDLSDQSEINLPSIQINETLNEAESDCKNHSNRQKGLCEDQHRIEFKPIIMSKTSLALKRSQCNKQDDPFLRDLTACLQMKQQQKKLTESLTTQDSANTSNEKAVCNNLSINTVLQSSQIAEKSPVLSNRPQLNTNSYNMVIKTPVSSRKCILNISCEKDTADDSLKAHQVSESNREQFFDCNSAFSSTSLAAKNVGLLTNELTITKRNLTTLASSNTFSDATIGLKLDEATQKSANESKFKSPSSLVLTTNLLSSTSKTNVTENKIEEDSFKKTKLNNLRSFNFASYNSNLNSPSTKSYLNETSIKAQTNQKVYATASTNTEHIITNSVSTSIDTDLIGKTKSSNGTKSVSRYSNDYSNNDKEIQVEFNDDWNEDLKNEDQIKREDLNKCANSETSLAIISRNNRRNKNANKLKLNLEAFLEYILFKEYNKNQMKVVMANLSETFNELHLSDILSKKITINNHSLIKCLNHEYLNDMRFRNEKVRVFFLM